MRKQLAAVLAAMVVAALPWPSAAGLVDSPIPLVMGQKMKVVYTVTGLIAGVHGLESAIFCTSLEGSKDVTVAVETFNHHGSLQNDVTAGNGVFVIVVGETSVFGTNTIDAIGEDEALEDVVLDAGSARILANSSRLLCTAAVVSATGAPPSSYSAVPVFKKTSQKGD